MVSLAEYSRYPKTIVGVAPTILATICAWCNGSTRASKPLGQGSIPWACAPFLSNDFLSVLVK